MKQTISNSTNRIDSLYAANACTQEDSASRHVWQVHATSHKLPEKACFSRVVNHLAKAAALSLLLAVLSPALSAQIVQTIKGTVSDKASKITLPGATVYINGSNPVKGTTSDESGHFRLEGVETGRVQLCIRYLGYEPLCIDNLNLTAGKELVVDIEMEESITTLNEVVVKAEENKSATVNTMSVISSRTFSIEETQRYAGARNDVARMAINYAGVSAGNDATNEIIIRGNSPNGLLWQLEGVEISNPNHFGWMGATGGPVGMLNNNTLSNSDFLTGAFVAEYGNALSGVFDLRMREGNHDKHEFLGQIGFNGFEFGAEGPISAKHKSSYLVNYRYSTLGLFKLMGISLGTGTAVPQYQDISFKVTSALGKGKISLFGLAGTSGIEFLDSERDTSKNDNFYADEGLDIYNNNRQGVIGLTYFRRLGESAFTELILSADALQNKSRVDTVLKNPDSVRLFERNDFNSQNYTANLSVTVKLSPRLNTRTGVEIRKMDFELRDSIYMSEYDAFFNLYNDKGSTMLLRAFAEMNLKLTEGLTFHAGLHAMGLTMNSQAVAEPRLAFRYRAGNNHAFSLGYGNHSRILPMYVYFKRIDLDQNTYIQPNKDLEMLKARHFVAAWDWQISSFTRLKLEGYYQQLYNAVTEANPSTFSMLNNNSFQFAIPDTLTNGGTGSNTGIELTLERFMHKGVYFLVTASLFDSKYKGSDDVTRSTAFDGGYVLNSLAGKEFNLKSRHPQKKNYLTADFKLTAAGGQRYTPVDVNRSQIEGETVYDESKAYEESFRDYFRFDIRLAYRRDNSRYSQEFAFDVQNITNRENPLYMQYNRRTGETEFINQLRIFPMVQYRIIF